jgi:hypothetical protein
VTERPSLFEAGPAKPSPGRFTPALQALGAGVLLGAAKVALALAGGEFLTAGLPVLTALLGSVVFTLAIVLSGVLADFKEAERGLGEMVSQVRRLNADVALLGAEATDVAALRDQLRLFVGLVRESARHGFRWRLRDLHAPLNAMDLILEKVRPLPTLRTVQGGMGTLTRTVDRLEVIVETTFMQAGYAFSAVSISLVLACFLCAPFGPPAVGGVLLGAMGFVLVGLYLLVHDLDNPLAGSVRISLLQLEALADDLKDAGKPAS